jgi:hypothetical protein
MIHLRASKPIHCDTIDLYAFEHIDNSQTATARPLIFETFNNSEWRTGTVRHQPFLSLSANSAQSLLWELMNDLWNIGVRPTDDIRKDQNEALNNHLLDMRKIVSKCLKVKL